MYHKELWLSIKIVPYTLLNSETQILEELAKAKESGQEGLMIKLDSPYNTTNSWLKLKLTDTIDAFVIRNVATRTTSETGEYWSYSMGVYDRNGQIVELGEASSAVEEVFHNREAIKPGVVLEIRHQPTKGFSHLRSPTIMKIRTDKVPSECKLEDQKALALVREARLEVEH